MASQEAYSLYSYNLVGSTVALGLEAIFQPDALEVDEGMTVLSRQIGHLLLPIASNRWQVVGIDGTLNTAESEDPDASLGLFASYVGNPNIHVLDMSRASVQLGVDIVSMGIAPVSSRSEALVQIRHIRAARELSFTGLSMAGAVLLSEYRGEASDYTGEMNG